MGETDYTRAHDEYNVICEYHRAEDQLKWQVLGIAYGGTAVLGGFALNARFSYASVFAAMAAAALASLGTAVYFRIGRYTLWRLERARELEKDILEFNHHRLVNDRYHAANASGRINAVIQMGYWLPWVLWAAFVATAMYVRLRR